jgi:branched-chain amino acid transport system substrate-binding protein
MRSTRLKLNIVAISVAGAMLVMSNSAFAQKKYDTGATDTEIKIGNIMPYSGPASAYGVIGKMEEAYFKMINEQGGINGRKINFITYDDSYSPPKAVEQARKLVESDEVLFIFGSLGTASNSAIQKYMNAKKVPQLFVATGATKFGDYKEFPWTMGWQPPYQSESRIYAKYLMDKKPDAKVAILYQNDDFGKDMLKGLKDGLGAKAASMIIAEETYEVAEPSIDSHIVKLKSTGADVFFSFTTPKFAAQSLKKAAELGWKPMYFQSNVGGSVGSVLKPAGFDTAQGILSAAYAKDGADSQWDNDAGMKKFYDVLAKYAPELNRNDASVVYGYGQAQTLVQVLKQAGNDLTRENIMKQAASLKDFVPDTLLPGVKINTSATDFYPIEQLQIQQFKGEKYELIGPIINGELGG